MKPLFTARLFQAAERASATVEQTAEKYRYVILTLWSLAYFAGTCYRAHRKLLWFDELYTFYMSDLPSIRAIWHVITSGVDYNPPLFYLVTRWSEAILGHNQLGARMPAILGFWVLSLCAYRFVAARTSALTGLVSLSLPLLTMAYDYSYEARPHGLLIGFGGLALVSWQIAADRASRRLLPLVALALSSACALLSHPYGIVVFTPLIVGEIVRTIRNRRPDIPMWFALACGASVILVSVPLLRAAHTYLPPSFSRARVSTFFLIYPEVFGGATIVFCLAFAFLCRSGFRHASAAEHKPEGLHRWESAAAAAAALLIPVQVTALALFFKAPLHFRYNIFAVIGVACLVGASLSQKPLAALLCFLCAFGVWMENMHLFRAGDFMTQPNSGGMQVPTQMGAVEDVYHWMETDPHKDLPIVLVDEFEFALLLQYAPPELKSRLMYRTIPNMHRGWLALQKCCGAPGLVLPDNVDTFLAYGGEKSEKRFIELRSEGATLTLDKASPTGYLYLVHFDAARRPPREFTEH